VIDSASLNNEIVKTFYPTPESSQDAPVLQLIVPRQLANGQTYGPPEEIINSFDLTVCRAALIDLDNAVVDDGFFPDFAQKVANVRIVHCPIGGMKRLLKYQAKGYLVPNYELFKMMRVAICMNETKHEQFRDIGSTLSALNEYRNTLFWEGEEVSEDKEVDEDSLKSLYFAMNVD